VRNKTSGCNIFCPLAIPAKTKSGKASSSLKKGMCCSSKNAAISFSCSSVGCYYISAHIQIYLKNQQQQKSHSFSRMAFL
jgi:hypothetical protein